MDLINCTLEVNMNLREELNKEKKKIKKEEEITEREKVFIEYIKGNKISKEDEDKILDELQSCIDKNSYSNSIYERELEYCSNFKCTDWKRRKKNNSHYKYIINELEKLKTLPKAIQLVIKNTENANNLKSYNKFLKENNIKSLQDNYTIEELENTIIAIAVKLQRKIYR